jgi:hypothetical protein
MILAPPNVRQRIWTPATHARWRDETLTEIGLVATWWGNDASGITLPDHGPNGLNATLLPNSGGNWSGGTFTGTNIPAIGGTAPSYTSTADGRAELGKPAALVNLTTLTIEAWIKPASYPGTNAYIFAQRDGGGNRYAAYLYATTGYLSFDIVGTGGSALCRSTTAPGTTGLSHVVVVYDDSGDRKARIYYNGSLVGTGGAVSGALVDGTNIGLAIGNMGGGGRPYNGTLPIINAYSVAESAAWVYYRYLLGLNQRLGRRITA